MTLVQAGLWSYSTRKAGTRLGLLTRLPFDPCRVSIGPAVIGVAR